jgi:hypothetical protein
LHRVRAFALAAEKEEKAAAEGHGGDGRFADHPERWNDRTASHAKDMSHDLADGNWGRAKKFHDNPYNDPARSHAIGTKMPYCSSKCMQVLSCEMHI